MRRSELERNAEEGLILFDAVEQASLVCEHQIRPVHPIVFGDHVWFHGAPKGEKSSWLGRRVTLSVNRVICRIPSHWRHPERACPATTYYRSAQVDGVLVAEEDPVRKAAVLQAMMERYQPEGEHRPITADDPLYRSAVRGLVVARVEGTMRVRAKLGENLTEPAFLRVLEGLWSRGAPGDDAAIEELLAERASVLPEFLAGPHGSRLIARIPAEREPEALSLVRDAYWNERWDDEVIKGAMRGSQIFVGIEHDGALIATARATSDRSKMVYIGDVAVREDWRGRGVGTALLRHLLSHGAARTRWASLHTTPETARFYEPLGFRVWPGPGAPRRVELKRFR